LAQFRSNAYNFNVTVSRSDEMSLLESKSALRQALRA
jgi:hypothetical protein